MRHIALNITKAERYIYQNPHIATKDRAGIEIPHSHWDLVASALLIFLITEFGDKSDAPGLILVLKSKRRRRGADLVTSAGANTNL